MLLLEKNSWILWFLLCLCLVLSYGSSAVYFFPSESNLSDLSINENYTFEENEKYAKFKSHKEDELGEKSSKWLGGWKRKSFVQAEIWLDNTLLNLKEDKYLDLTYTHVYRLSAKLEGSILPRTKLYSHHFIFLTDSDGKEGIRIDFGPKERAIKGNPLIEISRYVKKNETTLSRNKMPFQVPISFRLVADILFHASYPKYNMDQSLPYRTNDSGYSNCQTLSKQLEIKIISSVKYMALSCDKAKVKCRKCEGDFEENTFSYSRRDVKCECCKRSCLKMECPVFKCSDCRRNRCIDCASGRIPVTDSWGCCNKKDNKIMEIEGPRYNSAE